MIPRCHITGKVYDPSGTPAAGGTLTVELSFPGVVRDPVDSSDHQVGGGTRAVITTAGEVDLYLIPNGKVTPAGTHYLATFQACGARWTQRWSVPDQEACELGDLVDVGATLPFAYCEVLGALPDPSEAFRGKPVIIEEAGEADGYLVCLRNADGTFGWVWFGGGLP